jgi:hypothetical protein
MHGAGDHMTRYKNELRWGQLNGGTGTLTCHLDSRKKDALERRVTILGQAEMPALCSNRDLARPSGNQRVRGRVANSGGILWVLVALFAFVSAPAKANGLKEETLARWNDYISSACLTAEARAKRSPFLRISELPERRLHVRAGETLVWRESDGHLEKMPHGLVHDWAGAIFIPKATIADVLAVARDYDHYAEVYAPAVVQANRLSSEENDDRFSMLLMQKVLFVTAALKGEYETRYVQVEAKRWYSVSQSIRLESIENYGQPDMRALPPDHGPGYVWRLYSLTRFEESDGGVYVELEALGLSRDVPMMVRWLVDPVVEHLPRNSLQATLEKTRNAVLAKINREGLTVKLNTR